MNLNEFLSKNKIVLEEPVLEFCQEGIGMMKKSIDPFHDEGHVFRILDNLDVFLGENDEVNKGEIDFEELLISICWHDAWKSRQFPRHWWSAVYQIFWEGIGSMRLFTREAKKSNIEKTLIESIRYNIRKHSRFQFWPTKDLEAKIMKDADNLDFWSLERMEIAAREIAKNGWISRPLIQTARLFISFMMLINRSSFYFEWSKKEAEKRKEIYLEGVKNLVDRCETEYLKRQPPV